MTDRPVVLIVEDDPSMLEGIRDVLELDGYEVVTASNGQDALLRMSQTRPGVIVSDVMMPELDGYEFCEQVRQRSEWASIPFIFLTAKGQKLDVRTGMQAGADDYLTKPFDSDELLDALHARLARVASIAAQSTDQVGRLRSSIMRLISHELRTPLTFVKGYTELLEESAEDLSPSELGEFLRSIRMGSDRLNGLVDDLIFLIGLEAGEVNAAYEYEKSWLNLADVAHDVVRDLRNLAGMRGMSIIDRLIGKTLPIIGHRAFLTDALSRLVGNAIKFAKPEGGQVILAGQSSAQEVRLWVVDNGLGIPESQLGHIFDAFYQVDRERLEQQGAGIGLPIARGIARLHGGDVMVESREGVGSTFTLVIPASVNMRESERAFSSRLNVSVRYP